MNVRNVIDKIHEIDDEVKFLNDKNKDDLTDEEMRFSDIADLLAEYKEYLLSQNIEQKEENSMAYFSMHNHTYYSYLDGYASPKEYFEACKRNNVSGFAITDHGNTLS